MLIEIYEVDKVQVELLLNRCVTVRPELAEGYLERFDKLRANELVFG